MTPIDRFRTALGAFGDLVRRAEGRWDAPSPLPGWTARDLVEHTTDAHRTLLTMLGVEPTDPPSGPRAGWEHTEAAVRDVLDDPGLPTRELPGPMGTITGSDLLEMSLPEPLVHGWDLATAIGADPTIDPDLAIHALAVAQRHEAMLRAPGMYGPALEPPVDADPGERLLAYLGRDPRH